MKESYDVINVVFIHEEKTFGTVENLGAFASVVKYQKDGLEIEELLENEEFAIVDEIVLTHIQEE